MLLKMKTAFKKQARLSLRELSRILNLSLPFTEELLRCLIEKGKVRRFEMKDLVCNQGICNQCPKQNEEYYVWQEI